MAYTDRFGRTGRDGVGEGTSTRGTRTPVDDGNEGKGNDPRRRRIKARQRDRAKGRRGGTVNHAARMRKKLRAAMRARRKAQK